MRINRAQGSRVTWQPASRDLRQETASTKNKDIPPNKEHSRRHCAGVLQWIEGAMGRGGADIFLPCIKLFYRQNINFQKQTATGESLFEAITVCSSPPPLGKRGGFLSPFKPFLCSRPHVALRSSLQNVSFITRNGGNKASESPIRSRMASSMF